MRRAALAALLLIATTSVAFALSPAGRWEGMIRLFGSPTQTLYTFDVSSQFSDERGAFLTGTMTLVGLGAELDLLDGRVRNDSVSFAVDLGGSTITSRGRVVGDTLYLFSNFGQFGGEALNTFVRVP